MSTSDPSPHRPIATMKEGPLHAALKSWYAQSGDRVEAPVDGRQIDLVRGALLIEIQTASLGALQPKLTHLLDEHPMRVVHPVVKEKWVTRVDDDGVSVIGRRKSPMRGTLTDVFEGLVNIAKFVRHENFSFEVLMTQEDEVRKHEHGRVWRRKGWVIIERGLIDVVERHVFSEPNDYLRLLPTDIPALFTTKDLAESWAVSRDLAQKAAYSLREIGVIVAEGKRGNSVLHRVVNDAGA